ncbi:unnamed protein product, partial [Nesidiocoris tenuis]
MFSFHKLNLLGSWYGFAQTLSANRLRRFRPYSHLKIDTISRCTNFISDVSHVQNSNLKN